MTDLRARLDRTLGADYAIERELAGGGMSHVFVAEERAFGRRVVIKLLREDLTEGVSAERFKREISVAAKLQHPHIVPLLSAGHSEHALYYTMPFVEGESLRERLSREGELPVADSVRVLRELSGALDYAHRRGIIHRDIKPENVLFSDGSAVITDFGIAKALDVARTEGDARVHTITQLGMTVGTPAYMSPEQGTGDPTLDHRTDIYSLGCVAYELLAGRPPFDHRTPSQLLAAHAAEVPTPIVARRANTPPQLAALVMQCLEKRPADRPQSAEMVRRALESVSVTTQSGGAAIRATTAIEDATAARSSWMRRSAWLLAAAAGLGAGVIGALAFSSVPTTSSVIRSVIPLPGQPGNEALYFAYAISPDGRYVAVDAVVGDSGGIFIRALDSLDYRLIPGSSPGASSRAPDGKSVAFFASRKLNRADVNGGRVEEICDLGPRGLVPTFSGSWGARDTIVFSSHMGGPTRVVSAKGGPCRILGDPSDTRTRLYPHFLPDGRHFLYTTRDGDAPGIYLASLDDPVGRRLLNDVSSAHLAPTSSDGAPAQLLFIRNGQLLSQPFNLRALRIEGEPIVLDRRAQYADDGSAAASAARNGLLAHFGGRNREIDSRLVLLDANGTRIQAEGTAGPPSPVSVSSDGRTAAVWRGQPGQRNGDIYLRQFGRGEERLTMNTVPYGTTNTVWSSDGSRIVFASASDGWLELFTKDLRSSAEATRLVSGGSTKNPTDWSRDGYVVYTEMDSIAGADIWALRVPTDPATSQRPIPIVRTRFNESFGQISPNGRWLAYLSDETGTFEVYVQSFPSGEAKRRVTFTESGGGLTQQPRWAPSGDAIFYLTGSTGRLSLMRVPIRFGDPTPEVGRPTRVFDAAINAYAPVTGSFFYSPLPDGRFLVDVIDASAEPALSLWLNWQRALPTKR